ncbi:MAG: hypothetical protein JXJ22_09360 [Bacteroidales bacterium]|nr:hypothetical protein [Bacteroidales bacterium]
MLYTENYNILKKKFKIDNPRMRIEELNLEINNYLFTATKNSWLPGIKISSTDETKTLSQFPDEEIQENNSFNYSVFKNINVIRSQGAILLLHGLNERTWDKYLCWAQYLAEHTGKAVILFPISFHVNRSPALWHNPREMTKLSENRKIQYSTVKNSSFVNAALSERLCNSPERFIYSGYQSYYDVLKLITGIKSGTHPDFEKGTVIDFFGYSIGAYLAQVMLIANPDNMLDNSKVTLFCGGPVLEKINAASKYIMDTVAFEKIRNFLLDEKIWVRKISRNFIENLAADKIGPAFKSMLSAKGFRKIREKVFSQSRERLQVIALKNDHVMPYKHINNTFNGKLKKPLIKINLLDYPYVYSHETLFPVFKGNQSTLVDLNFEKTFKLAADFLR